MTDGARMIRGPAFATRASAGRDLLFQTEHASVGLRACSLQYISLQFSMNKGLLVSVGEELCGGVSYTLSCSDCQSQCAQT